MDEMEKMISELIQKRKTENDAFVKLLDAMKNQLDEVEQPKINSRNTQYSRTPKK